MLKTKNTEINDDPEDVKMQNVAYTLFKSDTCQF